MSLADDYYAWLGRCLEAGTKMVQYHCPDCNQIIHSLKPAKGQRPFDSLTICHACEKSHFKTVTPAGQVFVQSPPSVA